MIHPRYDYIIIGSGFGGAVSALRLSEKGYNVLVIEKGKWFQAKDFPKTNWHLRKWIWNPSLRLFGCFKLTFFRHVTVMSGIGVGGGSLVYGCALPEPPSGFFTSGYWKGLADWNKELGPYYTIARQMLGSTKNPRLEYGDIAMRQLAAELGKQSYFGPTEVGIFFGEPGKTVRDPFFKGKGPERAGCNFCGGCLVGCRYNAKNSLDKNYLYLAQALGATILTESEVYDVKPLDGAGGATGYTVKYKPATSRGKGGAVDAQGVVFAGGVLGTVDLLLNLKKNALPRLSDMVGKGVRTNNESIIAVTDHRQEKDFTTGVAIGSILQVDESSHVEPFRHNKGSGFWRLLVLPLTRGNNLFTRIGNIILDWIRYPVKNLRVMFIDDFAARTQGLLFMQQMDGQLQLKKGWLGMSTMLTGGPRPTSRISLAREIAQRYARIVNGKLYQMNMEILLDSPTTAHLLGGAVMGADSKQGVINKNNQVFGYKNMLVCDGSMISSNPGVNPALTITAITERAMSKIAPKSIAHF